MHHRLPRQRAFVATLAALAGYVDAVGFLTLGGYFVSFMSGNSTRLGVSSWADLRGAAIAFTLIVVFVSGVAVTTYAFHRSAARRPMHVLQLVAFVLALATALALANLPFIGMIAATFAMGAMNAVYHRESALPVGLTYMTGTLVRMGEAFANGALGHERGAWRPYAWHWAALVAGAAAGAFAHLLLGSAALGVASVTAIAVAYLLAT